MSSPRHKKTRSAAPRPRRRRGPHSFGEFEIPRGATVRGFARYFPTADPEPEDESPPDDTTPQGDVIK